MAASLLLLQLPRRLGWSARASPRQLASPRLLMLQLQARRDAPLSAAARSSSSPTAEPEPRPPPLLPSPSNPLRVAVVGSGPAGCYAASELFKRLGESVRVDILVSKKEGDGEKRNEGREKREQRETLEAPQKPRGKKLFFFSKQDKLPTPFGLVRSGVAPDHQDTKNVTNQFERVLRDGRARFFGNVEVIGSGERGRKRSDDGERDESSAAASSSSSSLSPSPSSAAPLPVRLRDLRRLYHAVVLAHGAESATPLGLPLARRRKKGTTGGGGTGEEALLPTSLSLSSPPSSGVVTARDFVLWANGHPELSHLNLDLRHLRSAVIVGAGNVALDCARLLLRSKKELLRGTDASRRALDAGLALDVSSSDEEEEEEEKEEGFFPLRTVHVVARRGAAQAAFSAKELREALSLPGVSVFIHHPPPFLLDEDLDPTDRTDMAASRRAARVFELLRKKAAEGGGEGSGASKSRKELHFHFLRSPVELIAAEEEDDEGASSPSPRVAAVRLVANRLETRREGGKEEGRTRRVAVPVAASLTFDSEKSDSVSASSSSSSPSTPTFLTLPAQLVIAALGFRTPSLGEGTPYDERRGVVPSGGGGRVCSSSSSNQAAAFRLRLPSSSPLPGPLRHGLGPQGPHGHHRGEPPRRGRGR